MLAVRREKSCEREEQSYKYKYDVGWHGHAYVLCEAVNEPLVKSAPASVGEILLLELMLVMGTCEGVEAILLLKGMFETGTRPGVGSIEIIVCEGVETILLLDLMSDKGSERVMEGPKTSGKLQVENTVTAGRSEKPVSGTAWVLLFWRRLLMVVVSETRRN